MDIEIIPGLQETDFAEIIRKISLVEELVDWVQIDVADGTMSTNNSYQQPELFKTLSTNLNLELHMMMQNPVPVMADFAESGFKRLIGHLEVNDPRDFIHEGRTLGVEVCLALDGPTELEALEPFLDEIDGVLVMMYKAGPSGQTPQPENIEKVRTLRKAYPLLPIEADGGMNEGLAKVLIEAGATRLVATSYLFKQNLQDLSGAMDRLRNS